MGLETLAIAGVMAGAQIYQGMAASAEARSQEAIAKYNAAVQEQEAKAIEARTKIAQRRQAEEAGRQMARIEAGIGASGAVGGVGSPLLIEAKQTSEAELESLMIGYEGMTAAARARSQAEMDRLQAKLYAKKAKNVMTGAYLGAGSTLLTGFNWPTSTTATTFENPMAVYGAP